MPAEGHDDPRVRGDGPKKCPSPERVISSFGIPMELRRRILQGLATNVQGAPDGEQGVAGEQ
jgi:hypothetical protein